MKIKKITLALISSLTAFNCFSQYTQFDVKPVSKPIFNVILGTPVDLKPCEDNKRTCFDVLGKHDFKITKMNVDDYPVGTFRIDYVNRNPMFDKGYFHINAMPNISILGMFVDEKLKDESIYLDHYTSSFIKNSSRDGFIHEVGWVRDLSKDDSTGNITNRYLYSETHAFLLGLKKYGIHLKCGDTDIFSGFDSKVYYSFLRCNGSTEEFSYTYENYYNNMVFRVKHNDMYKNIKRIEAFIEDKIVSENPI